MLQFSAGAVVSSELRVNTATHDPRLRHYATSQLALLSKTVAAAVRWSRARASAILALAAFGLMLGATPPAIVPSRPLPEIDIDPPLPLDCGWGQRLTAGQTRAPSDWTDNDWNPFTSGSATARGVGANLSAEASVSSICNNYPVGYCDCWSLATPPISPNGWLKAQVEAMPGEPASTPVLFQCDVEATVILQGALDAENWCWMYDGCASVSASLKLMTHGSLIACWGDTLAYRVDGNICESGSTVTAGGGVSGDGEVDMTAEISWSTTAPWQYQYNDTVRRWWQWCGNPNGAWVKLQTDIVGSAIGTNGGDASFLVKVENASVSFSVHRCECSSPGAPTGPLQQGGDGVNP
jgi:hypothetical protein